ncbi:VOC family protein [soil metagenome]
MPPFHYAFLVHDLETTRGFYVGLIGCTEGRSAPTWVDFDFFGHQISAHLGDATLKPTNLGLVDGKQVPMPHFGAVIDWAAFELLAQRLADAGQHFVLAPQTRYAGLPSEQRTMFLLDPSGNALEFKAFRDPAQVFAA